MKILLMIFLLPITVYASTPLFGSASVTIENRKGVYIFSTEEELTSTPDFEDEPDELFTSLDEPDAEDLILDE